jgi:hypothetical protein
MICRDRPLKSRGDPARRGQCAAPQDLDRIQPGATAHRVGHPPWAGPAPGLRFRTIRSPVGGDDLPAASSGRSAFRAQTGGQKFRLLHARCSARRVAPEA